MIFTKEGVQNGKKKSVENSTLGSRSSFWHNSEQLFPLKECL